MMQSNDARKGIDEITFARAFCAIGIVVYHFLSGSNSGIEFGHNYPNGTWGAAYVTAFFAISGAVMFYNYSDIPSVWKFWYKRAKAIFPAFYIAYAFCFLENLFKTGDPFSHGQPWCLIFSVFGLDGYLEGSVPTYYFIGEWFLGAIIILYLLYPLLLWAFKKSPPISTLAVAILYVWMLYTPLFEGTMHVRNIISCIMNFWVGMLAIKYKEILLDKLWPTCILAAFFLAANLTRIQLNLVFVNHLYGIAVFFMLYKLGGVVMKSSLMKKLFGKLSALSYPVFLVHHQIIFKVLGYQNPSSKAGTLVMFLMTILLTILAAEALDILTKSVLNTKTAKRIDSKIL